MTAVRSSLRSALVVLVACAVDAFLPRVGEAGQALRVSSDEAVAIALDHNLALKTARIGPALADLDVQSTGTAWTPSLSTRVGKTDGRTPAATPFDQAQTTLRTGQLTSDVALAQQLPWGSSYQVGWAGGRRTSNSAFALFQPELSSGLTASFTQPLLKGLFVDPNRTARAVSLGARDVADAELQTAVASTTRDVRYAYWRWIYARDVLAVQGQSLGLAQALLEGNRGRIAAGAMAAVDAIEAEAEVARRSEAIIVAEKNVANAEDLLRTLMLEPEDPRTAAPLEPSPAPAPSDIDASGGAVARAISTRQDLRAIRSGLHIDDVTIRQLRDEKLPDVSLHLGYALAGTGGTELIRASGVPGPVTGSIDRSFASVLDDLGRFKYPTWSMELAVSYPLGTARADVATARAELQQKQRTTALAAAEQRVATEVRAVHREVTANRKRLDSTATAVALSERRLDAEERKFAVGLSTSFFVFQAQRDLAQAREAALRALLDFRLSSADLEAVQVMPLGQATTSSVVP